MLETPEGLRGQVAVRGMRMLDALVCGGTIDISFKHQELETACAK